MATSENMTTRKKTLKTVSITIPGANPTIVDTADNMQATMALNDFLAGRDVTFVENDHTACIPYHSIRVVGVMKNVTSTEVTDAFCADGE